MVHLALEDGYQKLQRVGGRHITKRRILPRESRRRRDGLARSFVKERARERRDFGISGVQQLEKLAKQQLGQRPRTIPHVSREGLMESQQRR